MLSEPNETHLGLSVGLARGRGLGPDSAKSILDALKESEAVRTGLISDLEETVLLIPGIGPDLISDITTNIIRGPLIDYTTAICRQYGIPLSPNVDSGPVWNATNRNWDNFFVSLPMVDGEKLLLVPKSIVRVRLDYSVDEYYRHVILRRLAERELQAGSELVKIAKEGPPTIRLDDVQKKYGASKDLIVKETLADPELLKLYAKYKASNVHGPLSNEQLSDVTGAALPDYDSLLSTLLSLVPGNDQAIAYENAAHDLLVAVFYPMLTYPVKQSVLHNGRKRVDIEFANVADEGFFKWLSIHYRCPKVFVECKNYSSDPRNPEIDQLSGRFSDNRGKVGILLCRTIDDKELFIARCRDTADDGRGFIIPLDDADLAELVAARKEYDTQLDYPLLKARFDRLIN